jgi:hypothetical protein
MNSIFDEYYETLIKEAIGLNEMPVSRIASDISSFKPSKDLGSYSITDVTGEDEEKIKQVLIKVGEYVIDNLKEPSSASRKEYQDVVAEYIRKAINDVFPDSKKASGGKPFTARDYYAARAIIKAFEDQNIINTNDVGGKIQKGSVEKDELPQTVADITQDVSNEVEAKVQDDLDDTKEKQEENSSEVGEIGLVKGDKFEPTAVYSVSSDSEKENLNPIEKYALDYVEPETRGVDIVKMLKNSIKLRNKENEIRDLLDSLVKKGILAKTGEDEGSGRGVSKTGDDTVEDILKGMGPRENPETGVLGDL